MVSNKKSFISKAITILTISSLTLVSLTGCRPPEKADGSNTDYCETASDSSSSNPPVEISAVLAPTSTFVDFSTIINASQDKVKNELGFNLSDDELSNAKNRELSVILADGVPKLATLRAVDPLDDSVSDIEREIGTTFAAFENVSDCAAGSLKRKYDQIETAPESDILGGLAVAADQFSSSNSKKIIIVLSNGLQTSGNLKMQDAGSFPKSENYADQLANGLQEIGALPDLHGATVIWYGLGQVNGENQKLDQKARSSLAYFWQKVISLSNGELTTQNTFGQVGGGKPHKNAIHATPVNVPSCNLVIKLYEKDGVQFKPNSNSFVDPESAKAKAKEVVESFKSAGCDEITVHGYAAAGVDKTTYDSKKSSIDGTNKTLTLSRAKAFAALLKAAGFKGTINTEGVGTCGTEWNASGKIVPDLQKLCRRVEVSN